MTKEAPYVRAAFINAITEEGTKEEAIEWLQKTWNERCALTAEVERLKAALEPFSRAAGFHAIEAQVDESLQVLVKVAPGLSGALTVKDFRRARAALQSTEGEMGELR